MRREEDGEQTTTDDEHTGTERLKLDLYSLTKDS